MKKRLSLNSVLELSRKHQLEGKLAQARNLLKAAISNGHSSDILHNNLGVIYVSA